MNTPAEVLVDGLPADARWPMDRGLLYGDGLFETMLARQGTIRFEAEHAARLAEGCRRLGINADLPRIWSDARAAAARHVDATLRLQVTRGVAEARGYTPTGKEVVDRPLFGFTVSEEPPARQWLATQVSGAGATFAIPPNDPNWAAPPAQVEDYALLRAADITVRDGYDWFRVVDSRGGMIAGRGPYVGVGGGGASFGRHSSVGVGVSVGGIDLSGGPQLSRTLEIVMGRGPKPAGDVNAFDAREVINNLGPRVMRPTY